MTSCLSVATPIKTTQPPLNTLQLLQQFNAMLIDWSRNFKYVAQPKTEQVALHIDVSGFFQLNFSYDTKAQLQIEYYEKTRNHLLQSDVKHLCRSLILNSIQLQILYDQLMLILQRHFLASAEHSFSSYENLFHDLKLLQTHQNNHGLLFAQAGAALDHRLLDQTLCIDEFSEAFEQAWQTLQQRAFNFLQQLQNALAYIRNDLPISWYDFRYKSFEINHYYQMAQLWQPHLANLLAWSHESHNKLLWFILTADVEGVSNANYFSYEHMMQMQRGGVVLFEQKAQVRRLFQLPLHIFEYVLQIAFYQVERIGWWPALFFRWVLQENVVVQLQSFSPKQFEQAQMGLSMLWFMFEQHLQPDKIVYLPQYCYALNAIWLDYATRKFESEHCTDYIFGQKIDQDQYLEQPNIAQVHAKTTLNSLIKHSSIWHKQSQLLDALQYPFDYAAYEYQLGNAHFQLIANSDQLTLAARELQNCLLSFAQRIHDKKYFAFRVSTPEFIAALGLHFDHTYMNYQFDQCYGVKNHEVGRNLNYIAQRFVHYLTVNDVELWQDNHL